MKTPKLHDPRVLIFTLISAQAVVLTAGLIGLVWWLEHDLRAVMREQVLADNRQIARQAVDVIDGMKLGTTKEGTEDWQRLQGFVERVELPNQGFLCVVDNVSGELLCHPELRRDPGLDRTMPGAAELSDPRGSEPATLHETLQRSGRAGGSVRLDDGTHVVAAEAIAELGVTVLAHQRETGIDARVEPMTSALWPRGIAAGVVLLGLTGGATTVLVRRYEDRLMSANARLERRVKERTREVTETRDAVIFALARLAESRDDETGQHLERVGRYVELLARELSHHVPEITESTIARLRLASSLHDIGKVGVPDAVLRKPGSLSDDERRTIEKHPLVGGDTLHAVRQHLHAHDDFLVPACEIAFAHHEKWDGSGYPFGLAGETIPLAARIVALADVYDALTTDRVYRKALPHDEARTILLDGRGSHFDPRVVDAFLAQEDGFRETLEQQIPANADNPLTEQRLPA